MRNEAPNRAENVSAKVEREKLDNVINIDVSKVNFVNGTQEQQDEVLLMIKKRIRHWEKEWTSLFTQNQILL